MSTLASKLNGRSEASPSSLASRTASHAIGVLCVDDHAVLVEGLRAQFAIEGGIEIVGRLTSAAGLTEAVDRLKPHAVLLDIEMPGPDAFEMADRLKHAHPHVRVIVLSAHIRDSFISACFAAGISAYFAKSDELSDIIRGIHEVMRGPKGTFLLGPKVQARCHPLVTGAASAPVTVLSSLTPRETQILRLIGKGLSRGEIAQQLCRSVKTIDGHQDRMMTKLGVTTRADLMRLSIREGLAQA